LTAALTLTPAEEEAWAEEAWAGAEDGRSGMSMMSKMKLSDAGCCCCCC
jgi:hypothetical protein